MPLQSPLNDDGREMTGPKARDFLMCRFAAVVRRYLGHAAWQRFCACTKALPADEAR
jgi:hypothetical protein